MNEFLKKQKHFKKIRNILITLSAVYVLVYIGAEPYIAKAGLTSSPFQIVMFALVGCSLAVLFLYEARYAKAEAFLNDVNAEISDAGYYYTSRSETDVNAFTKEVISDIKSMGYKCTVDCDIKDLNFDIAAQKGSEFVYLTALTDVERNDVIAYLDSAFFDITSNRMRSKGNAVIVFVCNRADGGAQALSKTISKTFTGKRVLNIGIAIAELESSKVYFRGNEPSVIQKLVAELILKCALPIDGKYIGAEKLKSQLELKERLENFNLADFKKGKYYER